jgi:L-lysine 2,3-aminomutase
MEKFNLKKLHDVEVKEQYQFKISSRFAALENLDDDDVNIKRAWVSVREETIKASAKES